MRHGLVNRTLDPTTGHRLAMFRNLLAPLLDSDRIITAAPKAKELRPQVERLIPLGKNDSVHARRQAARLIEDDAIVSKLFDTVGPRFGDRPGGYTRIIKLGPRRGDAAEMAILEFVGYEPPKHESAASAEKAKGKAAKKAAEPEAEQEAAAAEEEKPAKKKPAAKKAPKKKEAEKPKKKPAAKKKTK